MARGILQGEGAWAWDAAQLELAVNEAPLHHQGQSLRLDRLVCLRAPRDGARWWVLDYKSAATPERQPQLIAQLQRYREAVRAQVPGEPVAAAFLSGDGRLVVLAPEPLAQG
jgi:ATP-dependent helicase/nuclease subunit A